MQTRNMVATTYNKLMLKSIRILLAIKVIRHTLSIKKNSI